MKRICSMGAVLLLVSGPAKASDAKAGEPAIPEPIRCYVMAAAVPGGMTVGLGVELCSGTTDADKTVQCFLKAWAHPHEGGLGLPRGLAVTLCKSNSLVL